VIRPSLPPYLAAAFFAVLLPVSATAQATNTGARSGVFFESYSFGAGLAFRNITELTIPVAVTQRIGNRVVLDFGTAYVRASVREAGGAMIEHAGLIDTDLRATVGVIPGRLLLNIVATVPTGATAVFDTAIPLFGATATDLLGFTTPSFGSGGGVSAGFASAFRMGSNWAIGTGASYRYTASYTPVKGGGTLTPGGEIRARFGVEGPFGGGKYFRGALIYTTTGANDIGGGQQSAIGDRILGYATVSLPLGRSHLAVYGWEMRRLRARSSDTAGTVSVPRGNVLALGARLEKPLTTRTTIVPLLEFRHELTGPNARMDLLGYLVRSGTDVRYRLSDRATGVVQAQIALGELQDEGTSVSLVGPRLGVLIEWLW
jgi:hypothetical protein